MEKLAKLNEDLINLAKPFTKVEIENPVQTLDLDTEACYPRISSKGINLQDLYQIPDFEDAEEAELIFKPRGITKRQWNFVNKFVEQIKRPRIEGKNHSQNLFYAVTETMPDLIDTYMLDLESPKMEHFIDDVRERVLVYLNEHKNALASNKEFFIDPVKAHKDSLVKEAEQATPEEIRAANKLDVEYAIKNADYLAAPDVEDINAKLKDELEGLKRANESLENQVAKTQRTGENRLNASRRANDKVKQKLRDKIYDLESAQADAESRLAEQEFYALVAEDAAKEEWFAWYLEKCKENKDLKDEVKKQAVDLAKNWERARELSQKTRVLLDELVEVEQDAADLGQAHQSVLQKNISLGAYARNVDKRNKKLYDANRKLKAELEKEKNKPQPKTQPRPAPQPQPKEQEGLPFTPVNPDAKKLKMLEDALYVGITPGITAAEERKVYETYLNGLEKISEDAREKESDRLNVLLGTVYNNLGAILLESFDKPDEAGKYFALAVACAEEEKSVAKPVNMAKVIEKLDTYKLNKMRSERKNAS